MNRTDGIEFDKIVINAALREHFEYNIPENKALLDKNGRPMKKRVDIPKASASGGAPKKATKKKTLGQPLAASGSRRVPPIRETKQPINDIAREAVPEVHIVASPGIPQDLNPIASVDREATRTKRVPNPKFRLVEETTEGLVSEEEIVLTYPREVVEDAVRASPQGTPPRRVKTFVRKRKGAGEKEIDMTGEVPKRSWIETINKHIHSWIGQVKSLFGHPEYEVSDWDAPKVEHILVESEVEEMNDSPRTPSLDCATTPPPPV
jgi:hypothetical protein